MNFLKLHSEPTWRNLINIQLFYSFERNAHTGCAYAFDGTGSVIAHAYYPEDGRVHLDDDELFTDQSNVGVNLYKVLVHEIGHVLGLGHSFVNGAVMNPVYQGYNGALVLHEDDINGMRMLYGKFYRILQVRYCKCQYQFGWQQGAAFPINFHVHCIIRTCEVQSQYKGNRQ